MILPLNSHALRATLAAAAARADAPLAAPYLDPLAATQIPLPDTTTAAHDGDGDAAAAHTRRTSIIFKF